MTNLHTANLIDVFADAVKAPAEDLRAGDSLFDTTGGTHLLTQVRHTKRLVKTTRQDGWTDTFVKTETITYLPARRI